MNIPRRTKLAADRLIMLKAWVQASTKLTYKIYN